MINGLFAALAPAVAVLAVAGWCRTRRWQKVSAADVAIAVIASVLVLAVDYLTFEGVAIAAGFVAVALVVVAPPRAWVALAVAGACALVGERVVTEPFIDEAPLGTSSYTITIVEFSDAYQTGLWSDGTPWTAVVLALGLLGWAVRRRSIGVAVMAVAFGWLAFVTIGPTASALIPLATAALAAYPRDRSYPLFAAGVLLGAAELYPVAARQTDFWRYDAPHINPLWTWLAAIALGTLLLGWSLLRKDMRFGVVALAALLACGTGTAALPAAVLAAGALVVRVTTRTAGRSGGRPTRSPAP